MLKCKHLLILTLTDETALGIFQEIICIYAISLKEKQKLLLFFQLFFRTVKLSQTVLDIKDQFSEILKVSEEIKIDKWKKRPLKMRFKQALLHIFAPFM